MAFPTTGLLDSFTRADENPLSGGGNWDGPMYSGGSELLVTSNQIGQAGSFANSWWAASTFGPDCEAYMVMSTVSSGGGQMVLFVRVQSPGTTGIDGYELFDVSGTTRFFRIDNEAETQLGADITHSFSNGDSLGFEAIGSTLTAYDKSAGTWSSYGSRTDATYGSAGSIGAGINSSGPRGDDFSGGTITSGATFNRRAPQLMTVGAGT